MIITMMVAMGIGFGLAGTDFTVLGAGVQAGQPKVCDIKCPQRPKQVALQAEVCTEGAVLVCSDVAESVTAGPCICATGAPKCGCVQKAGHRGVL